MMECCCCCCALQYRIASRVESSVRYYSMMCDVFTQTLCRLSHSKVILLLHHGIQRAMKLRARYWSPRRLLLRITLSCIQQHRRQRDDTVWISSLYARLIYFQLVVVVGLRSQIQFNISSSSLLVQHLLLQMRFNSAGLECNYRHWQISRYRFTLGWIVLITRGHI